MLLRTLQIEERPTHCLLREAQVPSMAIPKTMSGRTRPIEKFAQAVAKCSPEVRRRSHLSTSMSSSETRRKASAYGKCIVKDYNSVHKDKCLTEFLRLKQCYVVGRLLDTIWMPVLTPHRRRRKGSDRDCA